VIANTSPLKCIKVGARNSPLSQAQTEEVLAELRSFYPHVEFDLLFVASQGDKDLATSLRTLNKTDFFTKEIDELILQGQCRVGIHSAKDLPDPLPKGLALAALTQGLDPADVLVMRKGESIETLPPGAVIATSSFRREEAVRQMRGDLTFIDLRGTVGHRLSKLDEGTADGIVVAEAALIRLGLTHLNRIRIPGKTTSHQGQLAIIGRADDLPLMNFFRCLDSRLHANKTALYLGLNPPQREDVRLIHYPIIKIEPRPLSDSPIEQVFQNLSDFTHLLFTSQSAVSIFFNYLILSKKSIDLIKKRVIMAIGKATAKKIVENGAVVQVCAQEESAEGLVKEFEKLDFANANILWPRSALSRDVLINYFRKKRVRVEACIIYDTYPNLDYPVPNLAHVDEIIFTSPSCVEAFLNIFGEIPKNKRLTCIGPVTKEALVSYIPLVIEELLNKTFQKNSFT
jgi:hydroxymethylbilane synthase